MNDSTYGPFFPLREVLNAANPARCDVWGITDSWEGGFHVQTYFILFFKRALASPEFARFWRRLPYVNSKSWIREELRDEAEPAAGAAAAQRGSAVPLLGRWWSASCRPWKATPQRKTSRPRTRRSSTTFSPTCCSARRFNSTHYFWDALITDFRAPFIKRDLLLKNPQGIVHVWRWADLIARQCDYDQ